MKRIIPIVIILAAIAGGYWWYNRPSEAALGPESTALVGSGTIEAETVAVTAELGGRILEIKVDEGDEVTGGQILVELDKSDLLAQEAQQASRLLERVFGQSQSGTGQCGSPAGGCSRGPGQTGPG